MIFQLEVISGKEIAEEVLSNIQKEIFVKKIKPVLSIILVGEDPASVLYVRNKIRKAELIGIGCRLKVVSDLAGKEEVVSIIHELNADKSVSGVVLQLPLPKGFSVADREELLALIDHKKDVDCFNLDASIQYPKFSPSRQRSKSNIQYPNSNLQAPVALAVREVLERGDSGWRDKKIVLVGCGKTGGKPVESMVNYELLITHGEKGEEFIKNRKSNFQVVDKDTEDISSIIQKADVVISCVGKVGIITGEMVRDGFFGVSVGLSKSKEGKWCSDFSDGAQKKAGCLTPVPGGIGPLTVAFLLRNVVCSIVN